MFKINLGDILRIIMLFGCTFAPLKAVTTGKDIMGIISVSPDQIPSAEISLEKLKAEIQVYYNNNKLPENFCLDETIANVKMKFSSQDMPENIRLLGHGETGSATMYIIGSDDADSNNSIASNPSTETFWREASEEAQNKPPELEVVNPAPDATTTTLGVIPTVTQFIPEKAPKEAPETLAPIQTSVSPEKAPELTPEGPTPIQAPVSPETTPEPTPEPKPETTPEPKPETTPEPKPEIISEPKPETTPEPKPEITPKTLEGIQNNIKGSSNIKGNPPNSINAAPKNPTSKSESPAQNNSTDPVKNSNTSNNALSINIATGNPGKDAKDIFSGPRLEDENSLGTTDSINNEKESQVQSEKNENKKIEDEEEEEEQKERDDEEEEEEEDEGEKGGDGQEQSDDDDDDDDEDDDDEEDNK